MPPPPTAMVRMRAARRPRPVTQAARARRLPVSVASRPVRIRAARVPWAAPATVGHQRARRTARARVPRGRPAPVVREDPEVGPPVATQCADRISTVVLGVAVSEIRVLRAAPSCPRSVMGCPVVNASAAPPRPSALRAHQRCSAAADERRTTRLRRLANVRPGPGADYVVPLRAVGPHRSAVFVVIGVPVIRLAAVPESAVSPGAPPSRPVPLLDAMSPPEPPTELPLAPNSLELSASSMSNRS